MKKRSFFSSSDLALKIVTLFAITACTSNPRSTDLGPNTDTASISTIRFEPGSSELGDQARRDLEALIQRARESETSHEKINAVSVVAWSDHAYPAAKTSPISSQDKLLVTERLKAIESYLKSRLPLKLAYRDYNMAERPGEFASLVSTADARMKRSLASTNQNVSTAVILISSQ